MALGQLKFDRVAEPCWAATVGSNSYIITRPPSTSSSQQKWITVYLGTGTLASVGTYDNLQDAITGANTDVLTRP